MNQAGSKKQRISVLIAIILTSLCLRAPITGIGPLTGMIQEDLGLNGAGAGMLTTIPLIVFAALSILFERIASKAGVGNSMFSWLVILAVGIGIRSIGSARALYAGTILIGGGIAAGNVMLPAIVKEYFPEKMGLMTGLYATLMSVMGGLSSGISVPLADHYGWRISLLIWIVIAGIAALAWLPMRSHPSGEILQTGPVSGRKDPAAPARPSIARSGMTWAIVFYFGIQSMVFYIFVAWLPGMIQDRGFDASVAGLFSSIFILIGIPATFLVPMFSQKEGDESLFNAIIGVLMTGGMVLMILGNDPAVLMFGVGCIGLAASASFSQSMALFVLRTRDSHDAAALSGLAQSVGYLFAAIGPALMGALRDHTGGWTIPLILISGLAFVEIILGWIVGKEKIIHGDR